MPMSFTLNVAWTWRVDRRSRVPDIVPVFASYTPDLPTMAVPEVPIARMRTWSVWNDDGGSDVPRGTPW
jgi:hypothetical protein